jgi:Uncharacterized conserved protein (DUF2164)
MRNRKMPEPIGELPAGLLLDFFIEEIGSVISDSTQRAQEFAPGHSQGNRNRLQI